MMAKMRRKLLFLVTLFIQSHCRIKEPDNTGSRHNRTASLQCSQPPTCSMTCAGAAIPRICPAVVPKCKYGCACYTYCENDVPVLNECFKTQDCIGKLARSPATSSSKHNIGYTSKIYLEKTEVDHSEISKFTSIARRNDWVGFGLKGISISALRPKAQRINEIKSNDANRNYKLEKNSAAEPIKVKASRLINYEIQARRLIGNIPEISQSSNCSQKPILNIAQKETGRKGRIQKKYFVRKNVKYRNDFKNLAHRQNSSVRCILPPKYVKNTFTDKIQVSNKRNSSGIWLPSKQTQINDHSAKSRVFDTNNCTTCLQTAHSQRVWKNLNNNLYGLNKYVQISRLLFTPSRYVRQGGPRSLNRQHGRRYLGGILPEFNMADKPSSHHNIIDKSIVQNMLIQRHHPKSIGSESRDVLVSWKKARARTLDRATNPLTNIEIGSDKESHNNMLRASVNYKLSLNTVPPRLMEDNQGNEVRYRNHEHDSNRILPAQYYNPRTLRLNDNVVKILSENNDDKITSSNNGIDPRIHSPNNRLIQSRNFKTLPPGINAEYHPKVQDYSPITPARKRSKTRSTNQEFQSSPRLQPSNTLQPV